MVLLPLTLPSFAGNCTLLARPDVVEVLNVFANQALYQLVLPNDPNLAGTQFNVQAIEFGPLWTLSQGGVGVIN